MPFHCDAVQAVGKPPIDLKTVPVDYLSLSAHKLGGPKGVGALILRQDAPFTPTLHGGHQECGRRGGTENVAAIIGFGQAAELARAEIADYASRVRPCATASKPNCSPASPARSATATRPSGWRTPPSSPSPASRREDLLLLLDQAGILAAAKADHPRTMV